MSDEKPKNGEDEEFNNPLDDLVEDADEIIVETMGEIPTGEGWMVHVVTKHIEPETKSFGPMPEEKAMELQAMILGGVPVLSFVLTPKAVDTVLVERADVVKS